MKYFIEVWLRDETKKLVLDMSLRSRENYHPHITLVRPFTTNDERRTREKILEASESLESIPFTLEGIGAFGETAYIPVVSPGLQELDGILERGLMPHVEFDEKLNDEKILHVTLEGNTRKRFPKTQDYAHRITILRNKLIWFTYDLVLKRMLTREESLDEDLWRKTMKQVLETFKKT